MANTLKFGNGEWYGKKDTILAYNDLNSNFKPLPFNFSRDSKATVVNKDGLIETVGSGQPRIDFLNDSKGALLLEPSRSNLFTYSEDIPQIFAETSLTDTFEYGIAPNGNQKSTRLQLTTLGTSRYADTITSLVTSGTTYTFSCYYKGIEGETAYIKVLVVDGTSVDKQIVFTGEWQREQVIFTAGSSTNLAYIVDTREGGNATDFEVWGAQLEEGSYATSYIPTQGSTVTRLADSCEQTTPDSVIGQTEGVVYAEVDWKGNDEESIFGVLYDGTVNNRMDFGYSATFNSFYFNVRTSGSGQGLMQYPNPNIGKYKIAIAYKNNDFSLWINGVNEASDSSGSVPITTKYNVGNYIGGGREYPIISSKLYDTKLTDQELIALTT